MKTKYWRVGPGEDASPSFILEAAQMIKEGKVVAFPTETVYGLGADATCTPAVQRIFEAKGRPSDNPLIVHIAERAQLDSLVYWNGDLAQRLMDRFWPGPLTLVLPAIPGAVSPAVTAGLSTLAVRMPDHPVAIRLITASGRPLAAPSANRSGRPSPTRGSHVREDLDGRIDGILDGGPTGIGLESTVVELIGGRIHILRPGGITVSQLRVLAEEVTIDESAAVTLPPPNSSPSLLLFEDGAHASGSLASGKPAAAAAPSRPGATVFGAPASSGALDTPARGAPGSDTTAPRSPGVKYKHYAPRGRMSIVKGNCPQQVAEWIREHIAIAGQDGERTGVLSFQNNAGQYNADLVLTFGNHREMAAAAQGLYSALRKFDEAQITFILAEACKEEGIGLAIMNRLIKAASYRVVQI